MQQALPLVFLALSLAVAPAMATAALLEVEQSVFGMDCVPCAYGVEKSLKKLDGVTTVRVSLNAGMVTITLAADNQLSLDQIRQRILDNGFTPKEAIVRVFGTLDSGGSQLRLTTSANTSYLLAPYATVGEAVWGKLKLIRTGSEVEVRGRVEAGAPGPLSIFVTAVDARR
ncbi:MAG: heavy-metal-associated domain-containing protein [Burkholderiales bacterium]